MLDLSQYKENNSESSKKRFNSTGEYMAEVTDIRFPDGYVEGEAFEVVYSVTTKNAKKVFSEIFFNNAYNARTNEFFDYLVKNNISLKDVTEFIGCREQLTFKKHVSGNRSMISIVKRKFIGHSTED